MELPGEDGGARRAVSTSLRATAAASAIEQFVRGVERNADGAPTVEVVAREVSRVEALLQAIPMDQLRELVIRLGVPADAMARGAVTEQAVRSTLIRLLMRNEPFVEAMTRPARREVQHITAAAAQARLRYLSAQLEQLRERRERQMGGDFTERLRLLLPSEQAIRDRLKGDRHTLTRTGFPSSVSLSPEMSQRLDAKWADWLCRFEQRSSVLHLERLSDDSARGI